MSPENQQPWNSRQTTLAKIIAEVFGGTPPQTSIEFPAIKTPEDSAIHVRAHVHRSPLASQTLTIDPDKLSEIIRRTHETSTIQATSSDIDNDDNL